MIILLLTTNFVNAQKPLNNYHNLNYALFNRLPQNSIKPILKNKNGFYWIQTYGEIVTSANNSSKLKMPLVIVSYCYNPMFIKVLFIGVMLFGAVFIYWIRHKTLQRNKAKLESAIELRTKELYDSYRVIQQASLIVFHDLKTPLKFLESSIQSFKLNYEGFTKEEALQQLELLQFNIQQIYSFTANLLNWLINSNKINYVLNDTNISLVIHEIYMFYLPIAAFKNNKLQYNFKPVETVKTNEDILKIIIRNLLDNSIKYTNTGVITINIEQRVEGIEILIKDNGSGFNVKNSTNATIDDPNFPKINLGLQIVDDLCKKLNITCTINSQIGVGTFCYLLVPYYHTKET